MRVTVEPTALATVADDEARESRQLEFGSWAVYLYCGVPPAVPQALLEVPAQGGYFNRTIGGRYLYHPISDCNTVAPHAAVPARWSNQARAMARTLAELPAGSRITDYISLGVIAKFFPAERIHEVLAQTQRTSVREGDLPAQVVVYYVIALALYMRCSYREVLRCLLAGVPWLLNPAAKVKITGKSGISPARRRLGAAPLQRLYQAVVAPIAQQRTRGAW
jgi:Insertion element 4 transposase N-terminal/KTSC domain